jgi:predicted glycoside hydrolase/deacetylase ChbG (UPF0249 family)
MPSTVMYIADDLGLSDRVNAAIFHAHTHGALRGAGLMMGQPGTDAAVALARDTPTLEVGWHLHLNDSLPCSIPVWPWGSSPARAGVAIGLSPRMRALARREIQLQWRQFVDTGLRCAFVNAHHHLHIHPFIRRTLVETIAGEFDGWMRWGRPEFFEATPARFGYGLLDRLLHAPQRKRLPFPLTSTVWGIDRTFKMNAAEIQATLPALGEGLHEFIFHPRSIESDADTRCLLELARQASANC